MNYSQIFPLRFAVGGRALALSVAVGISAGASAQDSFVGEPLRSLVNDYCIECHNPDEAKGKLDLEAAMSGSIGNQFELWDEVAWMLREREMPPEDEPDAKRPSEAEYDAAAAWLEDQLKGLSNSSDQRETILSSKHALINQYCVSCHNADEEEGDLVLEGLSLQDPTEDPELWEKVVKRLESRQMPPADRKRPNEASYDAVIASLTETLDAHASMNPRPGRVDTFRRLNRTEYANSIRDLLGVEIDAAALLPKDQESHGFDNVTVGDLSPSLVDRYISAAQKISRLAVGTPLKEPNSEIFRVKPDVTQEKHVAGLPLGTRGGTVIPYTFPQDGEYEISVRLMRDRNEHVEGLKEEHEMEVLLDRALVERFTIKPDRGDRRDDDMIDSHLKTRVFVEGGPKEVGVAFIKNPYSVLETKRKPFEAHYNYHRHPRLSPAVFQITITGPFDAEGVGETPSRERIFSQWPESAKEEEPAAKKILGRLMKLAYRREIETSDLARPMQFYREGTGEAGFEAGIERALTSILVSPEFLFRVERDPKGAEEDAYRISDLELASRLSFFLWSSLPDEELLDLAIAGKLSDPEVLREQTLRLLADSRSSSLVSNFAGQWLHLRNLESVTPDLRLFPDFDDNLRQSFRQETELFFESVIREDRSVLELLDSDYTFLNERLAQHYEIPNVFGSRFRRVELEPDSKRGGLLRQGSILTVTSYSTRTSPVIRGNWVLENIIGTPPPPPPPDVPTLEENRVDATASMRQQLEEHRANPACAGCHKLMDPIGFALENFDAVGRWRDYEDGAEIDVNGGLPDGSELKGVDNLEAGLLERPELFVRSLTEKLLTFAVGRGVVANDAPAVREIIRKGRADDYRFSSLVVGIVESVPFQMREKEQTKPSYAKN